MTICSLAEVSARLEKMAGQQHFETDLELYQYIESMAVAVLDSEFDNYDENELEGYLQAFLYLKQLEMRLDDADLI